MCAWVAEAHTVNCCLLLLQHLQEMQQAGQLLQPLQHNQDMRAIRAVPAQTMPTRLPQHRTGQASSGSDAEHSTAHLSATHRSLGQAFDCQFSDTRSGMQAVTVAAPSDAGQAVEQLLALDGPVDAAAVAAACEGRGFSLVLRDMPKRCRAVAALVGALEQQLGLPAGANLYYTPAGTREACCCC